MRCNHLMINAKLLQEVASLIGADSKDIVFTSGATESNNMAIKGVARFHKEKKRHIITTQTVCCFTTSWEIRSNIPY